MRFSRTLIALFFFSISISYSITCAALEPSLHKDKIDHMARQALHQLGGDDLVAFFGFNPTINVVDQIAPNAYAVAPRTIILSSGLLEIVANEQELRYVLAHEMAHLLLGHKHDARNELEQHIKQEYEADKLALKLLRNTDLSAEAGVSLLSRLESFGSENGLPLSEIFPSISMRKQQLNQQIAAAIVP